MRFVENTLHVLILSLDHLSYHTECCT